MTKEDLITKTCEVITDVAANVVTELRKSYNNGTFSMDLTKVKTEGYSVPKLLATHLLEKELNKLRVTEKGGYDRQFVLFCRKIVKSIKL